MADEARGETKRSLTWLWMVLALVTVTGFLTWMGVASEPSSIAVVEEEPEEDDVLAPEAGVTDVPKDTLAADKSRYAGQRIRVQRVQATGALGPTVFWGELGDPSRQVPLLVRMDSALAAQGMQVEPSAFYTLTGQLHEMSDSVATAWGEAGAFTDEGGQMQATFADYYLSASNIRPSRGGTGGGGDDGAPGGGSAAGAEGR